MRSFLIATTLAATIAGVFTLITEPIAGTKSDISEQSVSGISKPAAKGNRLDYRPVDGCSLAREGQNYESRCVRFVNRWSIETSRPPAAA